MCAFLEQKKGEKDEFYHLVNNQRKNYISATILTSRTELALEPVVVLFSLIFLYFAVTKINMSVELIGIYFANLDEINTYCEGYLKSITIIKSISIGSIEVVNERLQQMLNSKEIDTGSMVLKPDKIEVKFNNVCYKYPSSNKLALDLLSFSLLANKMNAIVGTSGGGKSTLIDLIPRLRKPSAGSITINDIPIEGL